MKREFALDQIKNQEEPFDMIIVGGRATGLGTAVDGASRGHRVLLMEQAAFAAATSSRSTKLVHGGVRYHDGQFDDARLAINLTQTAAGCGACVVNYMKCVGLIKEENQVHGVLARDAESGETHEIRGRSVINATGVFVDDLRMQDDPEAKEIIALSQGIHIVLPKEFLPGEAAVMIPKTADGRVLFGVPWHDKVVVGTTDTPLQEPSMEPRALQEERDFIPPDYPARRGMVSSGFPTPASRARTRLGHERRPLHAAAKPPDTARYPAASAGSRLRDRLDCATAPHLPPASRPGY